MKSLISHKKLSQAKRLLYMTHMSIGDYVYQRMFLKKLQAEYPHLQIDLWFDHCSPKRVGAHLRRAETLMQWFKDETFLHELYPPAASLEEREVMIQQAQKEQYDIIVFSVDMECEYYANMARKISSNAYIVGTLIKLHDSFFKKINAFRQCDNFILTRSTLGVFQGHITEIYQKRFEKFFGLKTTSDEIKPLLEIPEFWQKYMREWLAKQKHQNNSGTVLINYLSTNKKRDWSFEQARELIIALDKRQPNRTYILNLPPEFLKIIKAKVEQDAELQNIHVIPFSAQQHFYELPALMILCDWVFSVETAIMHLASALSIPQMALVRQRAKTWAPLPNEKTHVIYAKGYLHQRIGDISVQDVINLA